MSVVLNGSTTPIEGARELIDVALADVGHMAGGDAAAELGQVIELAAKLDAYRVGLVSQIESSQVWAQGDPNATAASFLRREHGLDVGQANADLRAADGFERFPALADAAREGRVSRRAVDLILALGMRTPPRQDVFADFVDIFVDLAATAPLSSLREALTLWGDQIDPVSTKNDADDAHRRRYFNVNHLGDGVQIDGFLDPVAGAKLMAALNGALTALRNKNNDTGISPSPEADAEVSPIYGVVSSSSQQRADAFITGIVEPALAGDTLPTCGGAPAHVAVTVPIDRLIAPGEPINADTIKARLLDGTARLYTAHVEASNGPARMPISTTTAHMLTCDAAIQRVVLSPEGVPLDIGRTSRLIPNHLRKALIIRDGGCIFPYCRRPPGWTEGHHIQHWSQGGPTSLTNLALLCSKHHHEIHADSHQISINTTGRPEIKLKHVYRL